jgi:transcriptional regulator with XRE-family HTH domain
LLRTHAHFGRLLCMRVRHASVEVNGAELREVRKAAGLTGKEAAAKVNLSHTYYLQLERGYRKTCAPKTFNTIVALFNVDRDRLIRPLDEAEEPAP